MEEDFRAGHADADTVWKQTAQLVLDETAADHVPKIYNVPYYVDTPQGRVKNPEFLEEVRKIFKEDDQLVVGCGTGGRSSLATAHLLTAVIQGMPNVNNLRGGYRAWEKNGFPVIKQQQQQQPI
ncbi:Thiosulfate sulfurtransferase 18 [Linum grandiflorum]